MSVELSKVRIQATTLGDLLLLAADRYPDTAALVLPDKRIGYRELAERAMRKARALHALGVEPGDHVGLLLPTSMDFVETLFGIAMLGAVTVPINARYMPSELAYVIDNADLVTVLTTDEFGDAVNFVERLHSALPELATADDPGRLAIKAAPALRHVVVFGNTEAPGTMTGMAFAALAAKTDEDQVHLRRLQTRLGNTCLILYTSGTTANPKGCMISHEAMVRNSMALADRYALSASDRFWSPLPMFHIAAILPLAASAARGSTYVTTPHFKAGEALRMLEDENVTCTYPCFWTIMGDLIHHEDFATADLCKIRLMNANFAVQPAVVGEAMEKAMPDTVYVGTFGMTETAGTVTTGALDDSREQRFTRLGRTLPGLEIRAVDEHGNDVASGERGEAWIRGYSLFDRYYKAADKTAEALDADGWFHSGDLISIDADGQVMFHGRLKDMLKVGGENVAAVEIESQLQQHEAVKLAQVVGIPDARLQEVPAAFVELNAGHAVSEEQLIAFCKGRIAGFKVPRHVRTVTEWPQSSTKIQKFKLREHIMAELGLD